MKKTVDQVYYSTLKTKMGVLHLYASRSYLLGLSFKVNKKYNKSTKKDNRIIKMAKIQLNNYLKGKLKKFKLPLKLEGTKFQIKSWTELMNIPYGSVISYKEQAESINNPKAIRAIGSANGRNKFLIIIPCHRVINKSGSLGGYAGGLKNKRFLLDLERN